MNSTCELGRHATRALKPYPDYKDSGVPWLGEVPAHWAVRRMRTVCRILNGATPSSNTPGYWNGKIIWITPEDLGALNNRYIRDSARRITSQAYDSCGTSLAPSGSLAISTRAPIGHVGILSASACVNQGCRLLVPNESGVSAYLYHTLEAGQSELKSQGQGTTFAELSRGKLAGIPIALPPHSEQVTIVRFLDHADRRIRRYIQAKEKLITLLKEQKQAIINQAVTRGLDPNVRLKSSGVEWLGEVPKHWEVVRGKFLFRCIDVRSRTGEEELLTVSSEHGVVPRSSATVTMFKAESYLGYKLCWPGDLVINSLWAWGRGLGVSRYHGIVSSAYGVYRLRPPFSKYCHYIHRLVRSTPFNLELRVRSKGIWISRLQLTDEAFLGALFPVPPVPEQAAIVSFLDRTTAALDAATTSAQRETSLLREYRTRLIADVVTGKFDVREAAARLPDEVEELEPFDETSALIDGEEKPSDDLDAVPEDAEV